MANGCEKADWKVDLQSLGRGGAVRFGRIRGEFGGLTLTNKLSITWRTGWPDGADIDKMSSAAEEAARDALKRSA